MSDTMGGGMGAGNVRVDVIFTAQNAAATAKQIAQIKSSLNQISKVSRGMTSGMAATGSALRMERMEAQGLSVNLRRASQEARAYGTATTLGVNQARKTHSQFAKEVRAFKKEQYKAGTAIVGRPQDFATLRKNFSSLRESTRDARLSGIATVNTMRTMGDGIARVGSRGLTSLERFRLRSFALRKDLDSVGFAMTDLGKKTSWLGRTMMLNLTLPIVGFAAAASKEFLKVQSQFFQLKKVMEFKIPTGQVEIDIETGAPSKAQMKAAFAPLKKEIRDLSEELGMSQAVVTGVFRDVAALGFDSDELITGWSKGIAELAAIGDIDMSTATEFFRSSNALFAEGDTQNAKLKSTIDLMAQFNAISDETSLQLQDLAQAFPEVAPVMQNFGFTAAEVGSALAGMFKLGIPSSEAAHALKFGFQRTVGFGNTKERIASLGVSFFDEQGMAQLGKGRQAIYQLAEALDSLGNQQRQEAIGEITGARQTARWGIYFRSVLEGERQLAKALEDRKLTVEELREIDSDYMRGLLASGEIQRQYNQMVKDGMISAEDVPDLSVLEDVGERYRIAMAAYKEDPATQWNIMMTFFKNALIDVGEFLVPIISEWGKKIAGFAQKLADLPEGFKKIAGAVLTLVASLGVLTVALGAVQSLFGSLMRVAAKAIPRLGMRNLMPEQAKAMLAASPGRQDIVRSGNRVMHNRWGGASSKMTPVGSLAALSGLGRGPTSAVAELNKGIKSSEDALRSLAATGDSAPKSLTRSMQKATKATGDARASVNNLNKADAAYRAALNTQSKVEKSTRKGQIQPGHIPRAQARANAAENVRRTKLIRDQAAVAAAGSTASASKALDKAASKAQKVEARRIAATRRGMVVPTSASPLAQAKFALSGDPAQKKGLLSPFNAIRNASRNAGDSVRENFSRAGKAVRESTKEVANNVKALEKSAQVAKSQVATTAALGAQQIKSAKAGVRAAEEALDTAMKQPAPMPVPGPSGKRVGKPIGRKTKRRAAEETAKRVAAPTAALATARGTEAATIAAASQANVVASGAAKSAGKAAVFAKMLSPIKMLKGAVLAFGGAFAKILPVILIAGAKILAVIGLVSLVVGGLAVAFVFVYNAIKNNWDKIRDAIEGPLQSLKNAFDQVKQAIGSIVEVFVGTIQTVLFGDILGGEKALSQSNMWQVVANVITIALNFVTFMLEKVAWVVTNIVAPVFSYLANIVGAGVGMIVKIIQLDFVGALAYMVKFFYSIVQPVFWIAEKIVEAFLWMVEKVLSIIRRVGGAAAGLLSFIPGVGAARNAIGNFIKGLEGGIKNIRQQDWTGGLGRSIDSWLDSNRIQLSFDTAANNTAIKKEGESAGQQLGETTSEAFNDAVGDNAGKGVGDKIVENLEEDILKDFLSVLKPKVREQMDEIRKELEKAFQKNKEAKLKIFDDQIKRIEDLEKSEEKLLKTQEYVERRRELMQKRALDTENYRRNRALAIYEGRISDVRQLDIDFVKNNKEISRDIQSVERDRAKELLAQARDDAKERIKIQKEAEEERLRVIEEAFQKQLDIILQYEPRTVGEFENMMNNMQNLAGQFGIEWPNTMQTGGQRYLTALANANQQIIQEFGWGAERGIMAWVDNFITEEARAILLEKVRGLSQDVGNAMADNMGGSSGAPGDGSGFPGGDGLPGGASGTVSAERLEEAKRLLESGSRFLRLIEPQGGPVNQEARGVAGPQGGKTVGFARSILGPQGPRAPRQLGTGGFSLNASRSGGAGMFDFDFSKDPFGIKDIAGEDKRTSFFERSKSFLGNAAFPILRGLPLLAGPRRDASEEGGGGGRQDLELPDIVTNPNQTVQDMRMTGGMAIAGFIQGLWTGAGDLVSAGFEIFFGWVKSVLRLFGIMSPSKVFDGIGQNVILGFIEGFFRTAISLPGRLISWLGGAIGALIRSAPGFIANVVGVISRMPGNIISAIGSFGSQLWQWGRSAFEWLRNNLPGFVSGILQWFRELPGRIISGASNLGSMLLGWARGAFNWLRDNLPGAVSGVMSWFGGLPSRIVSGIGSITGSLFGWVRDSFSGLLSLLPSAANGILNWFKELPGRLLEGIKNAVRSLPGVGMVAGIISKVFGFHTGGIVGQTKNKITPTGRDNEVAAVLLKGEGILPVNAMQKIGPQAFELLRRGMVGEAVAMAAGGVVTARAPRISASALSSLSSASRSMARSSSDGDVYISVDTFIGEEEWFKSMANKYDMKVSARKAKNNGSQNRSISSYNSNERNKYR